MDKLISNIESAVRKGKKALADRQFTIAFIYLEAAKLIAQALRDDTTFRDVKANLNTLIRDIGQIQSDFRSDLLADEDRKLLQLCFYNFLFCWAQANNQIPHRRMVIADKHGYWIPDPNKRGEHVWIGETRAEAMKVLQELYESLPAKYRSLPLNPMEN